MSLCIYHSPCADGFGAAWAVWKRFPDWEFYPGVYQNPPPDVTDRDVVLVDFSYKRSVLDEMAGEARSLLILDHHKSAAEDLVGLPAARSTWEQHVGYLGAPGCSAVGALFDMERSGAGIAWDFFHPDTQRPALIDHIEDRDLWRFALPGTREIQAALFSHPYDFMLWDGFMMGEPEGGILEGLRLEGAAIERKHHKDVAELVGVCRREMQIGGHVVPVASLPYTLTSDAGALMCEDGAPFAACYWDTPDGRVFSLRSLPDGMDVSEIAKQYGGGGHKNAAGFRAPLDQLAQFEL